MYVFNGLEGNMLAVALWIQSLFYMHSEMALFGLGVAAASLVALRQYMGLRKAQDFGAAMPKLFINIFVSGGIIIALTFPVSVQVVWMAEDKNGLHQPLDIQSRLKESEVGRGLIERYNLGGAYKTALAPLIENKNIVMPASIYTAFNLTSLFTYKLLSKVGWTGSFTRDMLPNMLARNQLTAQKGGQLIEKTLKQKDKIVNLGRAIDNNIQSLLMDALHETVVYVYGDNPNLSNKDKQSLFDALDTNWEGTGMSFVDLVQCREGVISVAGQTKNCLGYSIGLRAPIEGTSLDVIYVYSRFGGISADPDVTPDNPLILPSYKVVKKVTTQQLVDNILSHGGKLEGFVSIIGGGSGVGAGIGLMMMGLEDQWGRYGQAFRTRLKGDSGAIDPSVSGTESYNIAGMLVTAGTYFVSVAANLNPSGKGGSNQSIHNLVPQPMVSILNTAKTIKSNEPERFIRYDPQLRRVGDLLNTLLGKGNPDFEPLKTQAASLEKFGLDLLEGADKFYETTLGESVSLNNSSGESTVSIVDAFFFGPAGMIYQILMQALSIITWLVLVFMYLMLVLKTISEFVFIPYYIYQCVLTGSDNPLKIVLVKFIAIRLYTFGFIVAGMLAYFASAGVSGMGWVTDSITSQVIAMLLQILLVSIMTYKSMGLLSYSPSVAPEMSGIGGGGGGGSGGGGSSTSSGEREADKMASLSSVAKGTGMAAKGLSMAAGAATGGGLAALQMGATAVQEGASQTVKSAGDAAKGAGDAMKSASPGGGSSGGSGGGLSDALGGGKGGGGEGSGATDALGGGEGSGGGNRRQQGSRGGGGKGDSPDAGGGADKSGGADKGGGAGSGFDWTGGKSGLAAIGHGMAAGFKNPSLSFMDSAAGAANAMDKAAGGLDGGGKGGGMAATLANAASKTAGAVAKGHAHLASMTADMGSMAKKPFGYTEKNKKDVDTQAKSMKAARDALAGTVNEEPKKDKEQGEY